jgi:hypothetical protein
MCPEVITDDRRTGRRGGVVTTFDRDFWEQRWSQVLRDHADAVAEERPRDQAGSGVDAVICARRLPPGAAAR